MLYLVPALLLLACIYATDDTVGTFADQNMILALWSAVFLSDMNLAHTKTRMVLTMFCPGSDPCIAEGRPLQLCLGQIASLCSDLQRLHVMNEGLQSNTFVCLHLQSCPSSQAFAMVYSGLGIDNCMQWTLTPNKQTPTPACRGVSCRYLHIQCLLYLHIQ